MKVPFFSRSTKKVEGREVHLASMASTDSKASSGSSGSLSSGSGSSRREKRTGSLRKSGSLSSLLRERTGKLWSFGKQSTRSEVTEVSEQGAGSGVLSRELSETFRYFDKNGDGKISASELGEVLRALGIESTDEELHAMVREVDCDKDGFIDVEEFVQLNKMVSEVTEGEDDETKFMQEAFHVFDIDGDGYISSLELYRVLSGLGETGLTVEQCGRMIQNVDKDGNGLVDFSEFKCLMQDAQEDSTLPITNEMKGARDFAPTAQQLQATYQLLNGCGSLSTSLQAALQQLTQCFAVNSRISIN